MDGEERDEPGEREAREAAKWRRAHEVAARVRAVRGFRGYSQGDLAERTGLSRQYISELEQGKRPKPRGETLERLAEALEVTADQLRGCAPLTTGGIPEPPAEPAAEPAAEPGAEPGAVPPSAEVEVLHTILRDGSLVIRIRAPGPRTRRRRRPPPPRNPGRRPG